MTSVTDRIEKKVLLRAPRDRVWRAISDSRQFGSWFGAEFDGPFVAGGRVTGRIVPTKVDADVARAQEPHAGTRFEIRIDRIEPLKVFSFWWHPYAVDSTADNAIAPTTLVMFELEEAAGGTGLVITESGFDQIPLERRAEAFSSNEQGWEAQATLIEKYLILHAAA